MVFHLSRSQQRHLRLGSLHCLKEGRTIDNQTARERGLYRSGFVLLEPVPFLYARRQEICGRKTSEGGDSFKRLGCQRSGLIRELCLWIG